MQSRRGGHHHYNRDNNHSNNQNNRRRNNQLGSKHEGPKREAILDLEQYKDQQIRVKFIGGRQIIGNLKGFDQLMNLVLDNAVETLRGMYEDNTREIKDLDIISLKFLDRDVIRARTMARAS
jgi:U6 snRNA-associated Sm-like protein LSm7